MERFEVVPAAGGQTLTVYFTKKLLGDLAVAVTASQARDKPGRRAVAAAAGAPGHDARGGAGGGDRARIAGGEDRRGAAARRPRSHARRAGGQGVSAASAQRATLAAAFSFVTRPVSIVQTIAERPRQIFAFVGTAANVKEDVVQVSTTLRYQIKFAGADTFRLAVPAAVSDRLQIDGEGIKERRKSPRRSKRRHGRVDDRAAFRGAGPTDLHRYLRPETLPGRRCGTGSSCSRSALEVDRETGEIAVHKDRALSVEAKSGGLGGDRPSRTVDSRWAGRSPT